MTNYKRCDTYSRIPELDVVPKSYDDYKEKLDAKKEDLGMPAEIPSLDQVADDQKQNAYEQLCKL